MEEGGEFLTAEIELLTDTNTESPEVEALMRSAALELAPHGIRANCVAPGPVRTPMTQGLTDDPQALAHWVARIPLGRIADTAQVVPAVLFLASEAASLMTGSIVLADGGYVCW